jgi:FtsP/CotA-like multicopper oxidase with cupredoxin domain
MNDSISKRRLRERAASASNRRELIAAGFTRRDLAKLGLITSAGFLIPKNGLSARAMDSAGQVVGPLPSPTTTAFVDPLPIIAGPDAAPGRVAQNIDAPWTMGSDPTADPQAGEGRTKAHQVFNHPGCAPVDFYEVHQRSAAASMSSSLPMQSIWGFNGVYPGPTYVNYYGRPSLVRNCNDLPADNGGFGLNSVTTHLHNGHTASESDGFPCDYFETGQFYDQHYPNAHAGFTTPNIVPPEFRHSITGGDIRESLGTLWYHDHRVDFTSQNAYKGLAGFYLLYSGDGTGDSGDETTGFRLPSGRFDVPLMFNDKVFDNGTGEMFFDLFNLDGILGDKFLVNGCLQPFFEVQARRYRFRLLSGGPSRFYQFHLFDPAAPTMIRPFWQISSDGNLLPRPIFSTGIRLSVAERADIIIDFTGMAGKTLYLENRLQQFDGRGPTGTLLPPGGGDKVLQFRVVEARGGEDTDNSTNPVTLPPSSVAPFVYYPLAPQAVGEPIAVRRSFNFGRSNGQWDVNERFMDCDRTRFKVRRGSAERWVFRNSSGGWEHPIHVHFEEFQLLRRNSSLPPLAERGRKDVVRLGRNEEVEAFFRFHDFTGRYPIHCHNTIHEDHAMMLVFEVDDVGDTKTKP